MSANPGNKFYLKSIIRSNDRTRRGKQRRQTVSDIILTVKNPPDEEEENKEKTTKVVENEPQKQQNHFFPGAVALNSVILIFFLLYLEQKQKIHYRIKLFLNHPEEQKEFTTMFNTIHYFILILFFIGFSPIHILYFTNNNKNARLYEQTKNSFIIVLFSVLYAIIQEQNNILYLLLLFLTNSVILGLGILLEFNEIIHRKYFFMVLFLTFFIQSLPTITSGYKTTELPVVFYLLTFFWFLFGVIEILLHYKHTMSYFHIIIQIIFSWGIFFIIFESPKMI